MRELTYTPARSATRQGIAWAFLRVILRPRLWRPSRLGRCPCCGRFGLFLYSAERARAMDETTAAWSVSDDYREAVRRRENHVCCFCFASLRQQALALTALHTLGMSTTSELVATLRREPALRIHETDAYRTFRHPALYRCEGYVVSQYRPDSSCPAGVRNENLEQLSFESGCFDVVISADVLEHVANLEQVLREIARVLKVGGTHVFTVPVERELVQCRTRALQSPEGLVHVLPRLVHGDTKPPGESLVYRDFGCDTAAATSLPQLVSQEVEQPVGPRSEKVFRAVRVNRGGP